MPLKTPDRIRDLQRKLCQKAKQEPNFRFYALYDKVYRRDVVFHAYALVKEAGGGPGIDGITFTKIEEGQGGTEFADQLIKDLKEKTYKPDPVKRVMIPKDNGKQRPLGIPTIRDRVVQMAAKFLLEPIFEADFSDRSYGFRPQRSAHQALTQIQEAMLAGKTQVIDADLSKYFDTIDHSKLMKVVAERVSDASMLRLIKLWLKAPIIEEDKNGKRRYVGGGKRNKMGTPQGGVISPLLANLYLHLLDRIWDRHDFDRVYQARLIRYADDFVVLCANGTAQPYETVRTIVTRLGLSLNEEKTQIVDGNKDGFKFLGFEITLSRSFTSGKSFPLTEPSKKSINKIKNRITELTDRRRTMVPAKDIIKAVNNSLRGWANYFHFGHSTKAMRQLRLHVNQRVRIHMSRRHRVHSWSQGYKSFSNRRLKEVYGLYQLPMTPGWQRCMP